MGNNMKASNCYLKIALQTRDIKSNEMQTVQRLHSTNSDQRRDNRLDGTGFTQFYLPPTLLSTNGMSHPAFTS